MKPLGPVSQIDQSLWSCPWRHLLLSDIVFVTFVEIIAYSRYRYRKDLLIIWNQCDSRLPPSNFNLYMILSEGHHRRKGWSRLTFYHFTLMHYQNCIYPSLSRVRERGVSLLRSTMSTENGHSHASLSSMQLVPSGSNDVDNNIKNDYNNNNLQQQLDTRHRPERSKRISTTYRLSIMSLTRKLRKPKTSTTIEIGNTCHPYHKRGKVMSNNTVAAQNGDSAHRRRRSDPNIGQLKFALFGKLLLFESGT